jgi:hypothetical protein
VKAIHKRVGRLEDRYIPLPTAESPLVALLRERQRRNAEAEVARMRRSLMRMSEVYRSFRSYREGGSRTDE